MACFQAGAIITSRGRVWVLTWELNALSELEEILCRSDLKQSSGQSKKAKIITRLVFWELEWENWSHRIHSGEQPLGHTIWRSRYLVGAAGWA